MKIIFSYHRLLKATFILSMLFACTLVAELHAESAAADWPLYGRDYDNQRFSPLTEINSKNAHLLKLDWHYRTGKTGSFQTSPIVVGGMLFLTTPFNDVIAVDAGTGILVWRYEHKLESTDFCCGPANRGPAVFNGKVYTVTIDARLIALDQASGKVLWDRAITDTNAGTAEVLSPLLGVEELNGAIQTGQTGYSSNLAPQIYGNKIFVGITGAGYGLHLNLEDNNEQILSVGGLSGGGHGLRGFLVAYDIDNGEEIWRWYSVPESDWYGNWSEKTAYGVNLNREIELEKQAKTKYPDTWRFGGGSIYTTPAIDPELGLIYIGPAILHRKWTIAQGRAITYIQ